MTDSTDPHTSPQLNREDSASPANPSDSLPQSWTLSSLPDDHWRPTPIETGIGIFVTLVTCALLIGTSPLPVAGAIGLVAGLLLGIVAVLFTIDRSNPLVYVAATGLFLPAGGALISSVGLAVTRVHPNQGIVISTDPVGALVLVGGLFAAGIGASTVWWEGVASVNVVSMIKSSVLVLFGAVVWGVLDTIFRLSPLTQVLNATWTIIEAVVSPSPGSALSGLGGVSVAAFLVASAAVCLLIALRTLPLVELAAAPKQDAIAAHLDWNVRLLKLTALVCGFLSLVVAGMAGERSTFELPSIISGPLYAVTGSVTLRAVLIVISILSVLAVVLTYVIQHVSRMDADSLVTYGIPLGVGSALAGCAFLVAGPLLSKLMAGPLATSPTFVSTVQRLLIQSVLTPGLLAVTGLTVVLTIPLLIIILLVVLSPFLPANARSAALASNGIFAASIGVGLLGVLPLVVFGGLAASFIIWDVTQHATVLGLEVGRDSPSAHVELIHAAGSVLVGVCAIGLATGGLLAARMVPTVEGVTAVVAIVGAVVGVGIVLAAVRLA